MSTIKKIVRIIVPEISIKYLKKTLEFTKTFQGVEVNEPMDAVS